MSTMPTGIQEKLLQYPDYRWMENGQSIYSGALLKLYRTLDKLFLHWASELEAHEYQFPTFIPVRELSKLDYFQHFPHLITIPVTLDISESNLKHFTAKHEGACEKIQLAEIEPIRSVLTPAACYHFYIQFQNETLSQPRYVTTKAACFRHETHYAPLQRQWHFSMREIVCIGSMEEVNGFLDHFQTMLTGFFEKIRLNAEWQVATDPFFNPGQNPKALMQRLEPVKHEMVFDGHLAIGSINFHRNYFGEAFRINRNNEAAFSGCVAFGVDRWIYAFLNQYGFDEANWPDLSTLKEALS